MLCSIRHKPVWLLLACIGVLILTWKLSDWWFYRTEATNAFTHTVAVNALPPGKIIFSYSLPSIQGHDFTVLRTVEATAEPSSNVTILTACTRAPNCIPPWQPLEALQARGPFADTFIMNSYKQPWRYMIAEVLHDPSTVCTGYGATNKTYGKEGVVLLCLNVKQGMLLYHSERI